MPQVYHHRHGTWFLVGFIKATTFLISASFIFVSYVWESRRSKKNKKGNPHV